jgi:hypothetical protein
MRNPAPTLKNATLLIAMPMARNDTAQQSKGMATVAQACINGPRSDSRMQFTPSARDGK